MPPPPLPQTAALQQPQIVRPPYNSLQPNTALLRQQHAPHPPPPAPLHRQHNGLSSQQPRPTLPMLLRHQDRSAVQLPPLGEAIRARQEGGAAAAAAAAAFPLASQQRPPQLVVSDGTLPSPSGSPLAFASSPALRAVRTSFPHSNLLSLTHRTPSNSIEAARIPGTILSPSGPLYPPATSVADGAVSEALPTTTSSASASSVDVPPLLNQQATSGQQAPPPRQLPPLASQLVSGEPPTCSISTVNSSRIGQPLLSPAARVFAAEAPSGLGQQRPAPLAANPLTPASAHVLPTAPVPPPAAFFIDFNSGSITMQQDSGGGGRRHSSCSSEDSACSAEASKTDLQQSSPSSVLLDRPAELQHIPLSRSGTAIGTPSARPTTSKRVSSAAGDKGGAASSLPPHDLLASGAPPMASATRDLQHQQDVSNTFQILGGVNRPALNLDIVGITLSNQAQAASSSSTPRPVSSSSCASTTSYVSGGSEATYYDAAEQAEAEAHRHHQRLSQLNDLSALMQDGRNTFLYGGGGALEAEEERGEAVVLQRSHSHPGFTQSYGEGGSLDMLYHHNHYHHAANALHHGGMLGAEEDGCEEYETEGDEEEYEGEEEEEEEGEYEEDGGGSDVSSSYYLAGGAVQYSVDSRQQYMPAQQYSLYSGASDRERYMSGGGEDGGPATDEEGADEEDGDEEEEEEEEDLGSEGDHHAASGSSDPGGSAGHFGYNAVHMSGEAS